MADKAEFLKAIDDAILDADSLEQFVNGSDSETVLTRLSAEYPTLQNAIKTMFKNGGLPAIPFKTKEDMESSGLENGSYAVVTHDTNNNSGVYCLDNGVWSKSNYSPLLPDDYYILGDQVEALEIDPIEGAAINTTGNGSSVIAKGSGRSYLQYNVTNVRKISVAGASARFNWAFTDKSYTPISYSASGNAESDVPAGAFYALRTYKVNGQDEPNSLKITAQKRIYSLKTLSEKADDVFHSLGQEVPVPADIDIVEGAVINSPYLNGLFAEGENRKYIKIDVSQHGGIRVKGAAYDKPTWVWVRANKDMSDYSVISKAGDVTIVKPDNTHWLLRSYEINDPDGTGVYLENPDMVIDYLPESLTSFKERIDSNLDAFFEKGELAIDVSSNVVDGAIVNTPSLSPPINYFEGRKYLKIDVSTYKKIKITGATTEHSTWYWVGVNRDFTKFTPYTSTLGDGVVEVDDSIHWLIRNYEVVDPARDRYFYENPSMEIFYLSGEYRRFKESVQSNLATLNDIARNVNYSNSSIEEAMQADFDAGNTLKLSEFDGSNSDARIRNAIDFIKTRGYGILDLESGTHVINSSLLLPSNCWLYLNTSTLKLADGVFDTIIRNDGIVPNSNPYSFADELNENVNIRIFGKSNSEAFIEGPDHPYKAVDPVYGGDPVPWVGDRYGWRAVGILFANTKNYKIHDFKMSKTTNWAISQEHGCSNFEIFNIEFDTNVKTGDGVDVRIGSSYGKIYNITGITSDDTVAISCLKNFIPVYPSGRYMYPVQIGGDTDRGLGTEIHHIDIRDIRASGAHNGVRVLASGGGKVSYISIDGVSDETGLYGSSLVRVTSGYGVIASMGDIANITINNVISNRSSIAVVLDHNIKNSWINNVIQLKAGGVAIKNTATTDNVKITNIQGEVQ